MRPFTLEYRGYCAEWLLKKNKCEKVIGSTGLRRTCQTTSNLCPVREISRWRSARSCYPSLHTLAIMPLPWFHFSLTRVASKHALPHAATSFPSRRSSFLQCPLCLLCHCPSWPLITCLPYPSQFLSRPVSGSLLPSFLISPTINNATCWAGAFIELM